MGVTKMGADNGQDGGCHHRECNVFHGKSPFLLRRGQDGCVGTDDLGPSGFRQ